MSQEEISRSQKTEHNGPTVALQFRLLVAILSYSIPEFSQQENICHESFQSDLLIEQVTTSKSACPVGKSTSYRLGFGFVSTEGVTN